MACNYYFLNPFCHVISTTIGFIDVAENKAIAPREKSFFETFEKRPLSPNPCVRFKF